MRPKGHQHKTDPNVLEGNGHLGSLCGGSGSSSQAYLLFVAMIFEAIWQFAYADYLLAIDESFTQTFDLH